MQIQYHFLETADHFQFQKSQFISETKQYFVVVEIVCVIASTQVFRFEFGFNFIFTLLSLSENFSLLLQEIRACKHTRTRAHVCRLISIVQPARPATTTTTTAKTKPYWAVVEIVCVIASTQVFPKMFLFCFKSACKRTHALGGFEFFNGTSITWSTTALHTLTQILPLNMFTTSVSKHLLLISCSCEISKHRAYM